MAGGRTALLGIGGFDERLNVSAEDNDLCYRWLGAGGTVSYQPRMVIWHHDWRSEEQIKRLYVRYARGEGMFYAKHLRQGDLGVLRFLLEDLRHGSRAEIRALLHNRPRSGDRKLGILRGLPSGLASGLRNFRPEP
jgi:GT2 family glycosyltransferase